MPPGFLIRDRRPGVRDWHLGRRRCGRGGHAPFWEAFADSARDAELELEAALRGPNEIIFDVALSERRRARAEGILAKGNDSRTLEVLAWTSRFAEVLAFVSHKRTW